MMTSLSDLLHPSIVAVRARWQGRRQVLQDMSAQMAQVLELNAAEVHEALIERERLGPTGVGEGVAIPHARVLGLDRPVGGFARLVEPADFEALDDRKCDLIFMILAPTDAGPEHLRALARVSRLFRQEAVREGLRNAHSVDQVLQILCPDAASNAA